MIARNQDDPVNFVLSAGRTGTVFLTRLFEPVSNVQVVHEPFPARYELMLANMRNDFGLGKSLVRKLFLSSRKKRYASLSQNEKFIEVNPLMCPLVDLLKELDRPIHVVHMVREPLSWVKSISAFQASKYVRPFYPYIPFSTPFPSPRPAGWEKLNSTERQLWRWRFCNEQILAQREHFSRYSLVRYEDLFSQDQSKRMENVKSICETFEIPIDLVDTTSAFQQRQNPAPARSVAPVNEQVAFDICSDFSRQLGYA
jgi:hypothetical protein